MPLQLEIVTPERLAYSDTVDAVQLPGSEGELGVLPHHAPLVSTLGVGELRIRKGATEELFAIAGGFVQVRPDKVVVMAETADLASEIDLERAQEARREAERALESGYHEAADLAAARAGGSVFELAAAGLPSILVPYPHATAAHQEKNARWMADGGAAVVVPDGELDAERLRLEVGTLLADPDRLARMAAAARALARPDAAERIAAEVVRLTRP
jgi:ATP synthase F1 epsilon subunit